MRRLCYIHSMACLSQSTTLSVSSAQVFELLRHQPYLVSSRGKPVLHYYAPEGWVEGASVFYRLLYGAMVQHWEGVVSLRDGARCVVHLLDSQQSFLLDFEAEHEVCEQDGQVVLRDFLECSFVPEVEPQQEKLWQELELYHGLEARDLMARRFQQRDTGSMDTFSSGQAAG